MIKQAIIPLAGLGTRLLPLTSVFAKELLPINGKPGIEYILDECVQAGIREIIFIISDKKKMIKDYPLDLNERIIFLIKSCSNNPKSLEQWSRTFFLTDSVMLDILGSNGSIKIDYDLVFLIPLACYLLKRNIPKYLSLINF